MVLKYQLREGHGKNWRHISFHQTKANAIKKKKELQRYTKKNFPRGKGGYKGLHIVKRKRKKRR